MRRDGMTPTPNKDATMSLVSIRNLTKSYQRGPETVEVLPSGTLALTSGPVYDPEGKLTNTFTTIWRLDGDGRWRVVFDKGCPVDD